MKIWLPIFLLLISFVSTIDPCFAAESCDSTEAGTSNNAEERKDSACSPFVTCGTCSGFVQTARAIDLPQVVIERPKHSSTFIIPPVSTYTSSLLQPPRIG